MNDDIKAMASSITHHFASLWARTDRTTFSEHQLTVRHWETDFHCILAEGDFCFYGGQGWSPPT